MTKLVKFSLQLAGPMGSPAHTNGEETAPNPASIFINPLNSWSSDPPITEPRGLSLKTGQRNSKTLPGTSSRPPQGMALP